MGVFPLVVWALQNMSSSCRQPRSLRIGGTGGAWYGVVVSLQLFWQALFPFGGTWGLSEPPPFWSGEIESGLGGGLTSPLHAYLFVHPFLPSSFFPFPFPPYFVAFQRFLRQPSSPFSLVHSFTRRNKRPFQGRDQKKKGGISSSQYFI